MHLLSSVVLIAAAFGVLAVRGSSEAEGLPEAEPLRLVVRAEDVNNAKKPLLGRIEQVTKPTSIKEGPTSDTPQESGPTTTSDLLKMRTTTTTSQKIMVSLSKRLSFILKYRCFLPIR